MSQGHGASTAPIARPFSKQVAHCSSPQLVVIMGWSSSRALTARMAAGPVIRLVIISVLSRVGVRRFQFVARGIRPGIRRGAIRGGCRWVWLVRSSLRTAIRRSGRFRLARRRVSWGTVFGIGVSWCLLFVWVLCLSVDECGVVAVLPGLG